METIVWLAIFIVMLGIEIATLGLTTIWFAGGALLATLVAAIGLPVYVQIPVFLVVSVVLLLFTRPIAQKYFNKERIRTNAEGLVGQTAVVTENINNLKGMGKAVINGQEWTARSAEDAIELEKETKATIVAIEGVKLVLRVQ
ncbi:MAG: NfeD family protein [Lachnospiraceae bacterium]|nr:NfeD family protein [Lachnospiraceae bacterium]